MSQPYNDAYPTCERTYAELRVYPGDLDPVAITSKLGVEPTSSRTVGTTHEDSEGTEVTVPTSSWFLSSEGHVDSLDLRRHLDWLLDQLAASGDAVRELAQSTETDIAVWCTWRSAGGQGGPTLSPRQLMRIARLGIECRFEISFE